MNNQEANGRNASRDKVSRRLSGHALRLDLYRLMIYFHASEMLARLSDRSERCTSRAFLNDVEPGEIIRLLIQTAASSRSQTEGDDHNRPSDTTAKGEHVGEFLDWMEDSESSPLTLVEAGSRIVRAEDIILKNGEGGNSRGHFVTLQVRRLGTATRKGGWKANIDVVPFVELASSIASLFD